MKKLYFVLTALLLFLSPSLNVYASEHIEVDYGITFELSEDWERVPLDVESDYLNLKYESTQNGTLLVGAIDMYAQLPDEVKADTLREQLDNSYLTDNAIREMCGEYYNVESISTKQYGEYTFYIVEATYLDIVEETLDDGFVNESENMRVEIYLIMLNGYRLSFELYDLGRTDYFMSENGLVIKNAEFGSSRDSILESVDLSSIAPKENASRVNVSSNGPSYIDRAIEGGVLAAIVGGISLLSKRGKKEDNNKGQE